MQFIPIIPRAGNLLEDWLELRRVAALRGTRPVEARTLPPLVKQGPRAGLLPPETVPGERRNAAQEERRRYCRRTRKLPVLEELRSSVERRKRGQRSADPDRHIDEQA